MKVRFAINDRGELEDRDGNVLGRLTSLTLDVANSDRAVGTIGVGVEVEEPQTPEQKTPHSPPQTLGDSLIAEVYGHWRSRRPSAREEIPSGTHRQLKRAFKAGYTSEQLKAMIDALLASDWHRERNLQKLSTIFATKPGGKTFEDQLDYWLERSSLPSPTAVSGPAIERAKQELRFRDLDGSHQRAIALLEQHGIAVTWRRDRGGQPIPTFERT